MKSIVAGGIQRGETLELSDDGYPFVTLDEVNASRIPPVVEAVLERLGQRVTRLEAALADKPSPA